MYKVAAIGIDNRNTIGRRKKTVGREIVIGPTVIKFVTVMICAVLAIVYLTQSTAGANRGIKIRDLETRSGQLNLEKERLETEQARLNSLHTIESGVDTNSLEPVTSVDHLKN